MTAAPTHLQSAPPSAVADRPATVREVVGSLAFYVAFYAGSVLFVLAGCLVLAFSERALQLVAEGWSHWHAICCRVFVGIRIEQAALPLRSDVLYALRHESFFEAIDLPARFPRPAVFAKAELLRIPLWGVVGRNYGLIGVDRSAGASTLRTMLREARTRGAGRPLVIFPEGTRTPHDQPAPLQAGFAGLYKLLGLPVIPVAVRSGALYHRRWKRAGTISYIAGPEIPPGLPRAEVEARVLGVIAPPA